MLRSRPKTNLSFVGARHQPHPNPCLDIKVAVALLEWRSYVWTSPKTKAPTSGKSECSSTKN